MSNLAKSPNVCTGCRSRKKKCSGERPSCASCVKRGDLCYYAGAPSLMDLGLIDSLAFEWSEPNPETNHDWFPPHDQLVELVDLFFEKIYHYLPVIHRASFMPKINGHDCPLLLYAIIAVAASSHPNPQIQQSQSAWFAKAKDLFQKAIHSPDHPLQTLQAASLVIFQAMMYTDYATCWMALGETWRKAVAIGLNLLDGAPKSIMVALGVPMLTQWYEKEECRRALWMLFMLDRGMCFPIGLTHAVDDRKLRLNLPMSEDDFQSTGSVQGITYTPKIDRLITLVQEKTRQNKATMLQYIVLAHVFLGRICECVHSIDDDDAQTLDGLTSHLLRIRLILPRSATDLAAADYHDFIHVIWLSAIMNVNTIMLYHRPLPEGTSFDEPSEMSNNWPHCVGAARSMVSMIRDAARISSDLIINPHLSPMLFTCGRILVMEHKVPSTRESSVLRDDLEVLVFTFKRMREALQAVGKKFYGGLSYYLQESEEEARQSKAGGCRDLFKSCPKWPGEDDAPIDLDV